MKISQCVRKFRIVCRESAAKPKFPRELKTDENFDAGLTVSLISVWRSAISDSRYVNIESQATIPQSNSNSFWCHQLPIRSFETNIPWYGSNKSFSNEALIENATELLKNDMIHNKTWRLLLYWTLKTGMNR